MELLFAKISNIDDRYMFKKLFLSFSSMKKNNRSSYEDKNIYKAGIIEYTHK